MRNLILQQRSLKKVQTARGRILNLQPLPDLYVLDVNFSVVVYFKSLLLSLVFVLFFHL